MRSVLLERLFWSRWISVAMGQTRSRLASAREDAVPSPRALLPDWRCHAHSGWRVIRQRIETSFLERIPGAAMERLDARGLA